MLEGRCGWPVCRQVVVGEVVRRLACEGMAGSSPAAPRVALLGLEQRPETASGRFESCLVRPAERLVSIEADLAGRTGRLLDEQEPAGQGAAVVVMSSAVRGASPGTITGGASPGRFIWEAHLGGSLGWATWGPPITGVTSRHRSDLPPHQRPCASRKGRGVEGRRAVKCCRRSLASHPGPRGARR